MAKKKKSKAKAKARSTTRAKGNTRAKAARKKKASGSKAPAKKAAAKKSTVRKAASKKAASKKAASKKATSKKATSKKAAAKGAAKKKAGRKKAVRKKTLRRKVAKTSSRTLPASPKATSRSAGRTKKAAGSRKKAGGSGSGLAKRGKPGKDGEKVVQCIRGTAQRVHRQISREAKPELTFPVRSLSNVRYDPRQGYFQLGRGRSHRTLTVNTVKTFAQTLKMMALSKEMVEGQDFATKRDAYYQSKNWGEARFRSQEESDTVMDDIEAMFSLDGVSREQLRFYPEDHGGALAGELAVVARDPNTGKRIEIDCTQFGTGAYTIPHSVEHLQFRTDARFILAIETGGMFQRLQYHGYPKSARCVIVSMGGVPTRATRRFIRRLSEAKKIPVYAFVDCDPYGISNIYRTLKVGSGNAAHINQFFCVPGAHFLGVTPQDILDYELQDATHPLKDTDVKRAQDALKNDPFFQRHPPWRKALEQLLSMKVRAEQQALAKWGLNYVIEEYLPRKLARPQDFLP